MAATVFPLTLQVFYFTHCLYTAYWVLLILHAPEFWKYIIAPGIIFLLEITYRALSSFLGKGKTTISAGVVLPSRVTNLIIKRPHNFTFAPGDWVFVKIPAIAKSEWHPFTISSAPGKTDLVQKRKKNSHRIWVINSLEAFLHLRAYPLPRIILARAFGLLQE